LALRKLHYRWQKLFQQFPSVPVQDNNCNFQCSPAFD
jgi:hypothetical protein